MALAGRAAAAAAPPLGVMSLPPELQETILGCLDLKTRLKTAALVCKQWWELSVAPGLLRVVEASLPDDEAPALLRRMEAFCDWLLRHAAPHVRRLRIVAQSSMEQLNEAAEEELAEAILQELGGTLKALGAHRTLQDLSLCVHLEGMCVFKLRRGAGASAWPRALRGSLRRLRLDVEPMMLEITAPLQVRPPEWAHAPGGGSRCLPA